MMKQISSNALDLVIRRIVQCGKARQSGLDEYSLSYWDLELAKANYLRMRIEKRFKVSHPVLFVDFNLKKRVA